jgi:DNA-binding response OmpR family regulator
MAVPVVLIAEPDASQRQIIDLLLTAGGFDLNFVIDGREAMAFLQANTPDLVIAAVDLPVVDGLELCRKVRAVRRLARAPVILLTHDATTAAKLQSAAHAAGASLVLSAPLGDKNLSERAKALMQQQGQFRELRAVPARPRPAPAAAPMPAPVSSGQQPDALTEVAQLKQLVASLSQENAVLKRQLTATGRSSAGGGEVIADLRARLAEANELLAEYRRRHPELEAEQDKGGQRGLFRRKR